MGYWKNLQIFAQNNRLDPQERSTHDAYKADQMGLSWRERQSVEVNDDHALTWDEIELLTGGRPGSHTTPCPYCGTDKPDSTRFKIDRDLSCASWICFYCGVKGTATNPEAVASDQGKAWRKFDAKLKERERTDRVSSALKIWDETTAITDKTLGAVYLRAREVELPPNADAVMRWHGACPFGKRHTEPCIVSLFRDAITDQATAIHRTCIYSAMYGKAKRMALGPIAGSAIKLWPLADSQSLTIGEGIETVLAAIKLGVAEPPAWAASVAGNMPTLPVIPGVRRLTILADNDESGTGQEAADELCEEYQRCGREVKIFHPRTVKDFNDLLRKGARR
jgi:hypothetical protein